MTFIKNYFLRHAQNCIGSLGNMTRQPVASAMTITVIGIALAMPYGLNIVVRNGQAVAGGWESMRDFSVYLKPGSSLENASQLREQILQLNVVESAQLVSADQALTELQSNSAFSEVLEALDDNPLPHTIVIRPISAATPDALKDLQDELIARPIVDLVKLDTEWIERLKARHRVDRAPQYVPGAGTPGRLDCGCPARGRCDRHHWEYDPSGYPESARTNRSLETAWRQQRLRASTISVHRVLVWLLRCTLRITIIEYQPLGVKWTG